MHQEIAVDRLIQPADIRICLFKENMRHPGIDQISVRKGLYLSINADNSAFQFQSVPIGKTPLQRFFFFRNVSMPFKPVFNPLPCVFPVFRRDGLICIITVLAEKSVQMIFLHPEFLSR